MKKLFTILLATLALILVGQNNLTFAQEDEALKQLKEDMKFTGSSSASPEKAEKYFDATGKEKPSNWAVAEVGYAISRDYVPARLQNNYKQPITREEFCELYVTSIFAERNRMTSDKLTVDRFLAGITTTTKFSDTTDKYVMAAQIQGIVEGIGKGKFDPNGLITREQAAVMFMNKLQSDKLTITGLGEKEIGDLDKVAGWAREAVSRMYPSAIGGVKDYNYKTEEKAVFDPKGNLTREQAIAIVARVGGFAGSDTVRIRNYICLDYSYLDAEGRRYVVLDNFDMILTTSAI